MQDRNKDAGSQQRGRDKGMILTTGFEVEVYHLVIGAARCRLLLG
jgi:hypothetical protein